MQPHIVPPFSETDKWKAKINTCEGSSVFDSNLESLEKQVEKEEKALEAAEKARDAKKEEVQKAIDALIPLKDEYEKLVEQKRNEDNAKILDKADGNWINRASKKALKDTQVKMRTENRLKQQKLKSEAHLTSSSMHKNQMILKK